MRNVKRVLLISLLFILPAVLPGCDSGIGDDLRQSVDSTDCTLIQDVNFNVTDGLTTEWDAIDPDTIIDIQNDVTDPDLDIAYANFIHSSTNFSLQFEIALVGAPNNLYDILIQIGIYTLVINYNAVWEMELFEGANSLGFETVYPTSYGFEGEILSMPGIYQGSNLSVVIASRDNLLNEIDFTSRTCITVP